MAVDKLAACRYGACRHGAGTPAWKGAGTDQRIFSAAARAATTKCFPATAERRAKCSAADQHPDSNRPTAERYGNIEQHVDTEHDVDIDQYANGNGLAGAHRLPATA